MTAVDADALDWRLSSGRAAFFRGGPAMDANGDAEGRNTSSIFRLILKNNLCIEKCFRWVCSSGNFTACWSQELGICSIFAQ